MSILGHADTAHQGSAVLGPQRCCCKRDGTKASKECLQSCWQGFLIQFCGRRRSPGDGGGTSGGTNMANCPAHHEMLRRLAHD
eukprot:3668870-Amphidinium_carterae.1